MNTFCGTIDFVSPEVIEGKPYNERTDIWSCGVIAFLLLSGVPPFKGKNDADISRNIVTCNYDMDKNKVWDDIS